MAETSLPLVSARDLVVRYGTQIVLDNATITINEGERVGLVGRNGCGKSTFLQIVAGTGLPDAGEVTRRRDLVTAYMPQVFGLDDASTVRDSIMAGAKHVQALIDEYENLSAEDHRGGELLDRIEHFDGWNLDNRLKMLTANLQAPPLDRIIGTLSGGERRRVALCASLLARPDFLILDEPTNHLDTESIEWLEGFLGRYPGTCLFVTHDRYFLDRIATRIVELSRGQFQSFEGSYNDYLLWRAERQSAEEAQEAKRQKFLKRELMWVRRGVQARRTKSVDRIARYFEMAGQDGPEEEIDVELIIPQAPKMANRVLELRKVGIDLGGRTLVDGLNLNLEPGQRLGVVGRNGMGKSTLLKVMLGQLPPTRGEVEMGSRTEINYVDQNRMLLDDNKTVWQEVGGGLEVVWLGEESVSLRGYLRRFLFTEDRINSKIGLLSGGERSRVLLAKILKRGGNVLVLDEPTNDLDLGTLRLLEEALCFFGGVVVVVSHDRYFLNRVCTSILAFEGSPQLFQSTGNYDYYLEKRGARPALEAPTKGEAALPAAATPVAVAAPVAAAVIAPAPVPTPPARKARKLSYKEERELEGMEALIQTKEEEMHRLAALLVDQDFLAKRGAEFPQVDAQRAALEVEIAGLYARWEELESPKK